MIWNLLDPKPAEKVDQAAEVASAQPAKVSDSAISPQANKDRDSTPASLPESSAEADDAVRDPVAETTPNEVDYVKKCTRLYKSIEEATTDESWGPIIVFLDSGVWANSGLYGENIIDPITPAQQAMTWVTRFAPDDDQKVLWSQLPLHLAIVCDAPFSVIGRLIELYPQAVRCTDDQHMLPIHLALRHNASDDVVAYLLMQFPESVNAKGKDGRLPVDCALRAESKVRGKILEIFVKKTKVKSKVVLGSGKAIEKEILSLKTQLEAKTLALENAESKLAALEKMKDEMEVELLRKDTEVQQLKDLSAEGSLNKDAIAEMADNKLMGDMEMQRKLEELEEERDDALAMLKKAKETEMALRADLDKATDAVLNSSPGELDVLKNDVQKLNFMLLEKSRRDAQDQINVLREELEKSMKQNDKKNTTELRTMQRTMEELRNAATNTRTKDEINMLKDEVETLRAELKDKEDLNKTRAELEQLKKTIEVELKTTEGKTQAEVAALHKTVENMRVDELQTKTASQLSKLKKELQRVKKELQESDLLRKTKEDIAELNAIVDADLEYATGEAKVQLSANAKSLARITKALDKKNCSSTELLTIRKEVKMLRSDIKERQQSENVRKELLELKKIIEAELQNSGSKTRAEMQILKKVLKKVDAGQLHALNLDELSTHKSELEGIKEDLKRKDDASKMKKDLDEIKLTLQASVKAWNGKNKIVVSALLATAEDMRSSRIEKMSFKELSETKMELKELRAEVAKVEQATKTKSDLDQLKSTLEDALKSSEGVTAHELYAMKKVIDSIDVEQLDIKNKDEWDMIRTELNALKDDLKTKEAGETLLKKEIEELRGSRSGMDSKKKSKKWRGVFSRFRKGHEEESPFKASRAAERRHDSDDSDVETISPPSVYPGHRTDRDADDHSRSSFFNSLRSRRSRMSPKFTKPSGFRSSKQATKPTAKETRSVLTVDPNTGEVTMGRGEPKADDINPLSDAVSV